MSIEAYVDLLFREADDRFEKMRRNPVTGAIWFTGRDPVGPQKQLACRALKAREAFARAAPWDAPQLPLSYEQSERLKIGGLSHVVAWYAQSLAYCDFDIDEHPSFEDYARGVMSLTSLPPFIKRNRELMKRYPPRELYGLGPGLYWIPV